jgi:catechol 2,3-dioxygenase-like lactoylglutathione lyase family enzyme
MEIDHLTIPVRDYAASKSFYARALAPLGFAVRLDWPDKRKAFLGTDGTPSSLWLSESEAAGTLDISLAAPAREAVDAFHAAAIEAGAVAEYEPGVRAEHSPRYYATRVLDPDGNSLEAVFRGVAEARRPIAA